MPRKETKMWIFWKFVGIINETNLKDTIIRNVRLNLKKIIVCVDDFSWNGAGVESWYVIMFNLWRRIVNSREGK